MAPTGLLESFVGAIQASLSVLLIILYGCIAGAFKLLNADNTKSISKICVRMFLPALLITKLGSQFHADSIGKYAVVLVWALATHLVSFLMGFLAQYFLGLPDWTTVAVMFNNTTSYPLLLMSALGETGVLDSIIAKGEESSEAIERAKAYLLVFSTVSSCITFAVGPRLIDSENAPESDSDDEDSDEVSDSEDEANEASALLPSHNRSAMADYFGQNSFLSMRKKSNSSSHKPQKRRVYLFPEKKWIKLNPKTKWWLLFLSDFFNAPLIGALIGAVIGLVPPLHRAFFNDSTEGGIFNAWLTASLEKIGSIFVPLPVVVAGVSFYSSVIQEAKSSNSSGPKLPWKPTVFIMVVRFILWPVISISLIYVLAANTNAVGSDPILWFAMMLMPTGPPATKLIAMVQVSGADEEDESNIAKILTFCYMVSPILSFTVVGSLKASQACIGT